MQIKISVDQAVKRIFGSDYHPVKDVSQVWYMFTPFKFKNSTKIDYFRVFETPSRFHTSQQIYNRTLKQLLGFTHEIQIIFLQRNFQASYFLLKSQTNIISLRSLLELRKHCHEKVQSNILTKIIEFFVLLQEKHSDIMRQLTLDRIGLTKNGNLKICDYLVYFMDTKQDKSSVPQLNLKKNLNRLIQNLVIQAQQQKQLSIEDIYTQIVDYYGVSYANFLNQVLNQKSLRKDRILPLVKVQLNNEMDQDATVTDSFIQSIDLEQDIQVTHGSFSNRPKSKIKCTKTITATNNSTTSIKSAQLSFTTSKSYPKFKKTLIGFVILLIIAVVIGGIFLTLNYTNRPIKCGQSEFINQKNQCISCPVDCESCYGSGLYQCTSCKGDKFLHVKSQNPAVGFCKSECPSERIIASTHTCLQLQQQS